jgi:hypothetical protein
MPNVIFAYNSTTTIPAAGSQRKTYNIAFADDTASRVEGVRHDIIDFSRKRNVVGKTLILRFKIGATILKSSTDRDWFHSFFQAKHRWAVYGKFNDPANSGNDNLCKCDPPDDDIEININYDKEDGYNLESENVF